MVVLNFLIFLEHAQSLPDGERRNFAAKVALAFSFELDASE